MPTVPRTIDNQIQFFQTHLPQWQAHAEAIGLSESGVAELAAATDAAREAKARQSRLHNAARAATADLKDALERMMTLGSSAVQTIRAKAMVAGDQVYVLAQISRRGRKSKLGEPGAPYSFQTRVNSVGWVGLKWKCKNPPGAVGTVYQVFRQLDHTGAYEFIGASGEKKFVDDTVPPGTREIMYRVQAVRSTAKGMIGSCTVCLGSAFREQTGERMMRVRGDLLNRAA